MRCSRIRSIRVAQGRINDDTIPCWCVSLIIAAAFATAPVFAQGAAPAAYDATAERGETIVAANKGNEKLHDVATSDTAVTSELMVKQQILQVKDFQQLAPTLNFQAANGARLFNFSIRGIGTESFSVTAESSVATIIDGVECTRHDAAFDGLGDLERVEVLNGPLGKLQGSIPLPVLSASSSVCGAGAVAQTFPRDFDVISGQHLPRNSDGGSPKIRVGQQGRGG